MDAEGYPAQCAAGAGKGRVSASVKNSRQSLFPVSYTHLDVYKRQAVDFIWIADQKLHQVEFFCSEIDLSSGNADAAAFAVYAHISAFQNDFRLCDLYSRRGTAHDRLDARLYLKDVKGLGDIVILSLIHISSTLRR